MNLVGVFDQATGDAGVFQTIFMMRDMVNKSFLHPWIRERAAKLTAACNRRYDCEDYTLLQYVIGAIQYVRDPYGVEALHDPISVIETKLRRNEKPFGDCDDMSIYLATLLKSIGHPVRFRVVSRLQDGSFHHILVFCHGKSLDPTMVLGKWPKNPTRACQIDI